MGPSSDPPLRIQRKRAAEAALLRQKTPRLSAARWPRAACPSGLRSRGPWRSRSAPQGRCPARGCCHQARNWWWRGPPRGTTACRTGCWRCRPSSADRRPTRWCRRRGPASGWRRCPAGCCRCRPGSAAWGGRRSWPTSRRSGSRECGPRSGGVRVLRVGAGDIGAQRAVDRARRRGARRIVGAAARRRGAAGGAGAGRHARRRGSGAWVGRHVGAAGGVRRGGGAGLGLGNAAEADQGRGRQGDQRSAHGGPPSCGRLPRLWRKNAAPERRVASRSRGRSVAGPRAHCRGPAFPAACSVPVARCRAILASRARGCGA